MENKVFEFKSYSRQLSSKYFKYFELGKMDKNVVVGAHLELQSTLLHSPSGSKWSRATVERARWSAFAPFHEKFSSVLIRHQTSGKLLDPSQPGGSPRSGSVTSSVLFRAILG